MKETITWITDGSLPDSDITVLAQADDGVGEAFHDGECWRWSSSTRIPRNKVKAWADLPEGVK